MVFSGQNPSKNSQVSHIPTGRFVSFMHSVQCNAFLYAACACLILFILSSCSQNMPEIKNVNTAVILEYHDMNSLPSYRLSIFVDSSSDVHRSSHIEILSKNTGYKWECDSPVKIAGRNSRQWAGYTNFAVPDGSEIPAGMYDIKYMNADGESTESYFYISYDAECLSMKASETIEAMNSKGCRTNIALFDKDGILLYYGEQTPEFRDEASFLRNYSTAASYKKVLLASSSSLVCILPLTEITRP